MLDDQQKQQFQETVWEYYRAHGRHKLPWRIAEPDGCFDPYKIMVSEFMLQQTQVARAIPKYLTFLQQFPTVDAVAAAPLGQVLRAWSGLGYNRRAKFLQQAAQQLAGVHQGAFPRSPEELTLLPGIGRNTAGAIAAYAFNEPVVFIETNIRTVYLHHFFAKQEAVADKALLMLIAQTLEVEGPREWYWALMDYGSYLKRTAGNPNRLSKSYTRQSAFQGSKRQLRGQVIRVLGKASRTAAQLQKELVDERLALVLVELQREGLIRLQNGRYRL